LSLFRPNEGTRHNDTVTQAQLATRVYKLDSTTALCGGLAYLQVFVVSKQVTLAILEGRWREGTFYSAITLLLNKQPIGNVNKNPHPSHTAYYGHTNGTAHTHN